MADEEKLLLQLKNRDKYSIEQAIEVYTPYVSTVLYNFAGSSLSREDAEEIVADVFIMLWNNAQSIDLEKGSLRSYMAAATRNFALKKLKGQREYTPIEDIELPDEKNYVEDKVLCEFLWNSVMELGEPDSEIFVRFYKYGEKMRDIAKATGFNLSTIKSKLSRGREKLKKILNKAEELQ